MASKDYYIKLTRNSWLGHNGKPVPFNDPIVGMKRYKTLKGAQKAAGKLYRDELYTNVEIRQIDWSDPFTPTTWIMGVVDGYWKERELY